MENFNHNVLHYGFTAGTKAIDNYNSCCSLFGFKQSLSGNFTQQKMLYAKNATSEGYSVWMLAHSSLNEPFNKNKKWYNIFVYPDIIREIWFNPSDISASQEDYSYRVCFAKNKHGMYVFQGIYAPQKIEWEDVFGKKELVRTFKRISLVYPIEEHHKKEMPSTKVSAPSKEEALELPHVIDKCQIKAKILESNKDTTIAVDIVNRPFQNILIGKKVGDRFSLPNVKLTYEIKKIQQS